jgi:hypothetical protein
LLHFLDHCSLVFSRKPLTSAEGPQVRTELKDILLKGRRLDAEAALRRGDHALGVPSLVPASWQLVSGTRQGEERVLATHVASFDLDAEGRVLHSNGFGVFVLHAGAAPRLLLRDKLVAEVVAG